MKKNEVKYYPNKLESLISIDEIFTIHYFKYGRNFTGPGEAHPFWELVYIDSGVAEIQAGKKTLLLAQGEAIFHKPDEFHNIFTHKNYANSVIVSFKGKGKDLKELEGLEIKLTSKEKELLNLIVSEGSKAYTDKLDLVYLKKMTKNPNSPFGSDQLIKNNLEIFLIYLIRRVKGEKEQENSKAIEVTPTSRLALKIEEILKANLRNKLTLDDISSSVFASKTTCKKIFHKEFATSIMKRYQELKIEEAKRLLAENELSIREISDLLCFPSEQYFSSSFKQKEEMSPSEYRKSTKLNHLI
ncbi:MAG: AraC family transcriptional regulator [Bacilli bacterium]|jgi:AraC-like DNA-binding protein|nr:AraC family transcriptional regulator [Bacilli bacterium]